MKELYAQAVAIEGEIEIIPIADTHIGSPQCNESLVKETVDYILDKPNRYCILNGDIIDNCLISSVGNVYESKLTPSEAVSVAVGYLKPLADAGRILCTLGGNHDHDRSKKIADISPAEYLASMLDLTDRFSGDSVILFLTVKNGVKGHKNHNSTYKIFISHGRNGGSTNGSKVTATEKMSLICPNCDVYIHSHTHSPITFKDEYVFIEDAQQILVWKERLYVNTNAYLNYFNSYGEAKLYRPQSQSLPIIKLMSTRYKITGQDRRKDRIYKSMSCII